MRPPSSSPRLGPRALSVILVVLVVSALLWILSRTGAAAPVHPAFARHPVTLRMAQIDTTWDLPRVLGQTDWECESGDPRPRSMHAEELDEPLARRAALRSLVNGHEEGHRAWRLALGCSVSRWLLQYSAAARLQSEVAAFCAGVAAGVKSGWYPSWEAGLRDGAKTLATAYSFAPPEPDSRRLLDRACPPPTGPPR